MLGTLKYVAPERITGSASDHRADIYSFGCVLYEALAGQPPFVRQEEAAWLYAHVTEPPPRLTCYRPDLPPASTPSSSGHWRRTRPTGTPTAAP